MDERLINILGGMVEYFWGRVEIFLRERWKIFGECSNILGGEVKYFWGVVEYFDWQFYRKCGAEGLSDQVEVARRGRVWAGNGSGTTPANVEQLGGCPLPPLSAAECASAAAGAPVPAAANSSASTKQQSTLHRVQTVPDS